MHFHIYSMYHFIIFHFKTLDLISMCDKTTEKGDRPFYEMIKNVNAIGTKVENEPTKFHSKEKMMHC